MELAVSCVLFVLALLIIIISGNCMVSNAVKISSITGIPQALIGATIVSLATTLPELNVTVFSAMDGLTDLAIGNAIGSIIFNMTFVIGIIMLFTTNKIKYSAFGINFYIMIFVLVVIFITGILNIMNKWSGMLLLTIFLLFFIHNIIEANRKEENIDLFAIKKNKDKSGKLWLVIILFCLSSFFVSMGAKILVQNGERIARLLSISEHIIGVTIIAIGTSLPEVVTAISSIRQRSTSIAIGNIVGANILSSTLLVGISAILEPDRLVINNNILLIAIPLIIVSSLLLMYGVKKNRYKTTGVLLLVMFVLYYITVVV